ncbi:glycosyltransferase family 39 protein [Mucilaginibacter sp. UR6-11]|uniref:ArnT family glycosyltransferase n=1 Tax=Mucilaginibacter sp. UR6-11 TaxID=1435644 RepID=UPI001E3AA8F4|nr:glycosyltransferase family 39 protein [Mucilaginibacter sp. UR6-11]MCC8426651.1 glycosyltransferase family 39 protein [Mucilaginibacter sp. UR6-11]
MSYKNRKSSYTNFILIFVFIKILLNALAISNFGFHRDELLHLALGDHLDWGYKEVPPFIAVLAKLTTILFGSSVFAARIFTTVCSGLIIWLTGKITIELGGKKFAIALACLAILFSPAFIASGYLFQPVVFDQLWWVLTVWLLLRYINTHAVKYLYFIGIVIGLGVLTKYTMLFFAGALILGLTISRQRRLLWNKHVVGAIGVACAIILPNLIWQYSHHWPVFTHMATLQKEQLEYVKLTDFIIQQMLANGVALFVWIVGFFFLIFSFKLRKYQSLAIAYVLISIFLLQMNGKSYYLFGAYPMLFAAGGYGFERWIKSNPSLRAAILVVFTLPNLLVLPTVLPILPLKPTLGFFDYINKHTRFIKFMTVWEDHKHHATTQDYGDMFGWDEVTQKVAYQYGILTPDQRQHTVIYADNYGLAGALHHFGKQYNLPEPVCLSSSFALWAPDKIEAQYVIFINSTRYWNATEVFTPMVENCIQVDSITNPYAVEKGTAILLVKHPKPAFFERYQTKLAKTRAE